MSTPSDDYIAGFADGHRVGWKDHHSKVPGLRYAQALHAAIRDMLERVR